MNDKTKQNKTHVEKVDEIRDFFGMRKKKFIKYIINNETIFMAHGVICDVFTFKKEKKW